jgi:hypothetical protein
VVMSAKVKVVLQERENLLYRFEGNDARLGTLAGTQGMIAGMWSFVLLCRIPSTNCIFVN